MKYIGNFKLLTELGYNTNIYNTYYFYAPNKYSFVFIDIKSRDIEYSDIELLNSIKEYIEKE